MLHLVLTLALVGVVLWLVQAYLPAPAPIKMLIYVIVAICVIYYLINVFGIVDLPIPQVGHHR